MQQVIHRFAAAGAAVAMTLTMTACSSAAPLPSATSATPATTASGIASPSPTHSPLPSGVYAIECGADEHSPDAVEVLSPDAYRVGGWSHVNGVGAFETVALESSAYRVSPSNLVADPTCGGENTYSVVLAKKTYDWDKQHANGIESQFPSEEMAFGDVEAIVLDLRIDASRSVLPQAADYAAAYGDVMTAKQLAAFDNGNVNLELTLFGEGASGDTPFMNASVIVEVDPEEFGDGWVRVKVPREDLVFYTEANYERTPVRDGEHQGLLVQGLRINPETASGDEARVYIGDEFDPRAKPELFKEMAIAFSVIEVER